ncbi:MAG: amidohydrolase family protein [Pseudomonadota bacterium]
MLTEGSDLSVDFNPVTETLALGLQGRLWTMPASGGTATPLTEPTHTFRDPRVSPDGSMIVAVGGVAPDHRNLWLIDVETRRLTQLTDGPWLDANPCWHPAEPAIVFESNRSGNWQIWKQRIDDVDIQRISFEDGEAREPSFSQDGRALIYVQSRPGQYEIRQRFGTGRPVTLVRSSRPLRFPTARPRGILTTFWETEPDGHATLQMLLPTEQTIVKAVPETLDQTPSPIRWQDRDRYFVVRDGSIERRTFASPASERVPLTAWQTVLQPTPLPLQTPVFADSPRYVLRVGFVADVVTGRLIANQDVLVDAGRIVSVGPSKQWPGDTIIEFPHSTLMPSLIDIDQSAPPSNVHKAGGIVSTLAAVPRLSVPQNGRLQEGIDAIQDAPSDTLVHSIQGQPHLAYGVHLYADVPSNAVSIEPLLLASGSYLQLDTDGVLPRDSDGHRALTESRLFAGLQQRSRTASSNEIPPSVYSRLIASSTRSGFAAPLGLHANLLGLSQLGVPNRELVAAATWRPANLLGMSQHGLVEAGFVADLILVDGDPFNDLKALLNPLAIVDAGTLRSVEGLLNP